MHKEEGIIYVFFRRKNQMGHIQGRGGGISFGHSRPFGMGANEIRASFIA
jgi:hypothetical protein